MGWGMLVQGVGTAAGMFNAIDEAQANRRIAGDLDDIKQYLKEIKSALNIIKMQNQNILERLDKLSDEFHQIVEYEVAISQLTEKYSDLDDIWETFLIIQRGRDFNLQSVHWLKYSGAMNYVFDHENRISYLFNFINICEVALVISRGRSMPLVVFRLDEKIEAIRVLSESLLDNIKSSLNKLLLDLDNTKFVESHNLSFDLDNLSQLTYKKKPNRKKTQHYTEQVCETRCHGPRCDAETRVCHNEPRTRKIWDTAFHKTRDSHLLLIKKQVNVISKNISKLSHLNGVISALSRYRQRISPLALSEINSKSFVMYFDLDEQEKTTIKSKRRRLDEEDMKQFNQYFS